MAGHLARRRALSLCLAALSIVSAPDPLPAIAQSGPITTGPLIPTGTLSPHDELRRRLAKRDVGASVCGWLAGQESIPHTCNDVLTTCILDEARKMQGCAFAGSTVFYTSCVPYRSKDSCTGDCATNPSILEWYAQHRLMPDPDTEGPAPSRPALASLSRTSRH